MFCICGPNLAVLARIGDELSCGQTLDWHTATHAHTDRRRQRQYTQAKTAIFYDSSLTVAIILRIMDLPWYGNCIEWLPSWEYQANSRDLNIQNPCSVSISAAACHMHQHQAKQPIHKTTLTLILLTAFHKLQIIRIASTGNECTKYLINHKRYSRG